MNRDEIINKIKTNYNDCRGIRWGIINKTV